MVKNLTVVSIVLLLSLGLRADDNISSPASTPNEESPEAVEESAPIKVGDSSIAKDAKYVNKVEDPQSIKSDGGGVVETQELDADSKLPPRVEIIVDSSGSMGQMLLLDRSRMYFMKKLITRYFTDQFKQKAQTGLRVYGSKRVGDCEDNELLVPFSEKSLTSIEINVAKLQPVGKTPLYKAVRAAALDLKPYKGPKAIVVFTDGEDTCGGNPCKEGKIASEDPFLNTQIYIVGIGYQPDSKDLKKVSCLGETTTANSEDDLFNAMGGIHQKIFKSQLNLKVESPDPTAEVQVFRQVNGTWQYFKNFTAAFGTTVPPGTYQAVVLLEPRYKFESFVVPPKKSVTLKVQGTGTMEVNFVNRILDVEILDKNMSSVMKFKSDVPTKVPTGRWTIKISKQPFYEKFVERFDVYPGGTYKYKVIGASAVKIQAKDVQGFYVYDNKKNLLGNYLTNFPFALPNGEYAMHVDDKCSFEKVTLQEDSKLRVLKCK